MLVGVDFRSGFKSEVESLCDVVVSFRDEKFKTHALVLVLNSTFIANLLSDMKNEGMISSGINSEELYELPLTELFKDYEEEDVELLLAHFYDDSLEIEDMQQALYLRDMAHRLDASRLYDKTTQYAIQNMPLLQVDEHCKNEKSLLWCLEFCSKHGLQDLEFQFERYVCERIKDVLLLDQTRLNRLPVQNLVRVLSGVTTIAHKESTRVHNFMVGLRSCSHCRKVQSNGYSTCISCGLLKYTGDFSLSQWEYEAGLTTLSLKETEENNNNDEEELGQEFNSLTI